jgi:signal recognition particle subunit SRP72
MSAEVAVPTPKKVRMSRVPKGVIPGVTPPPDPERWLKKSERSTFGQGKKKKGAGGGGGGATQGSVETPTPAGRTGTAPTAKNKGKKKK